MVSLRCKMFVTKELNNLGVKNFTVELGSVDLREPVSDKQLKALKARLLLAGLEVMDDQKAILIEKINNVIVDSVYHSEKIPKINFSDYLSRKLGYDYSYLTNRYSETTGLTINQCFIAHRIERVKELIIYDELSLTQIAFDLHFSSVAHLSNQFKKVTGLTPSYFKELKKKKRLLIEHVGMM